jgi:hypothetical protein
MCNKDTNSFISIFFFLNSKGGNTTPLPPWPCSCHYGQVVQGCVTLWRQICPTPPPSPTLLATVAVKMQTVTQTKLFAPVVTVQVLTEINGQSCTSFSHRGEKITPYTVHTFSWLLLRFTAKSSASGPQSGKAPYHSLQLLHLAYSLYISD